MATHMTSFARSEIEALILRAARGAKQPLGWAEDVAHAVGSYGVVQAVDEVAESLGQRWKAMAEDNNATTFTGVGPAPIICALDAALTGQTQLHAKCVTPHLARALADAQGCHLTWSGPVASPEPGKALNRPRLERFEIEQETIDRLYHFASRTYVPDSQASRQSGAGAGLTDND